MRALSEVLGSAGFGGAGRGNRTPTDTKRRIRCPILLKIRCSSPPGATFAKGEFSRYSNPGKTHGEPTVIG
jgi:hypothetical protein